MFEFVRTHTRVLQFVLVLLIFPSFVFFGIQGYERFNSAGNETVAKVAGQEIKRSEWDAAYREQVERMQRQMPGIDVKLLDSPQMRLQVLEGLLRDRVLFTAADKLHLVVTDDRLQRLFATDPQFAMLRNPDGSVNKELLMAQGMSSEIFAQRLRQDFALRQVTQGIDGTVLAPTAVAAASVDALLQQREIQLQRFTTKDYLGKVTPTDVDIEAFYKDPKNAAQFEAPEQASIEYVVLDVDALKKDVTVTDEELRKYYAENESRYSTPAERRASHILVKAEKDAPADVRAKAKAKAEQLLAEVRKNPASFPDVARKNSDDPGSAQRGGDLDFFGRGAMVPPFENAAFSLERGKISDVVESDFGYHIIQVTDVRGGDKKPFEAVKAQIEDEVRRQLAQRKYSEAALEFTNMVYEQPDSLKPVADKYKLEIRKADKVSRTPAPGANGALANAKFLAALFGNDALKNKRNTEAVEVGTSQMASGRIVQYSPAHQRPLDEVKATVRERLASEQAAALAKKEGQARLAALQAAPETAIEGAPITVSRAQAGDLPREVIDAALRAPAGKLPAVVGADLGGQGYAVVKVTKVLGRDPVLADNSRAQAQYAQAWGDAEAQAYYASLKGRYKAAVTPAASAASAPVQN